MSTRSNRNHRLAIKLLLVAAGMFGFGFAMWPIYNVFCDITGLGGRGVKIAENGNSDTVSDRAVKIRFDATVNSALDWELQPSEPSAKVHLGEMRETTYLAVNESDQPSSGQAIYTVTPPEASLYFVKTECFCFTQQTLAGNESREMPVRFYIKPDLPEHIRELTLSYTFFHLEDTPGVAQGGNSRDAQE
jgi:cytochrome c oxidase assembly protein subunit 11